MEQKLLNLGMQSINIHQDNQLRVGEYPFSAFFVNASVFSTYNPCLYYLGVYFCFVSRAGLLFLVTVALDAMGINVELMNEDGCAMS